MCGLWARGLPSRSGSRGRGWGAVVGGRKREETGSLTAAASVRRLTASSPETAANSAVELPGPRPAAETWPCPASGAGAVGRRRARVDAGGGHIDCEKVPLPAFPSPHPSPGALGAGLGSKRGVLLRRDWVEECWGKRWDPDMWSGVS